MNTRPILRNVIVAAVALMAAASPILHSQEKPVLMPYKNAALSIEQRVSDLVARLTLEEKITLLGGTGFETKAIPRLSIPPFNMTDGPVGVRWGETSAFPVSIAMAATWDPDLVRQVGGALGREAKAKGRRMLLGPCVNIQRAPAAGRNFESFGEDPFLAARMAVSYVKGVQAEHVVATTKHYAANNQEYQRDFINVKVDERALREIYFPAFEAAVREGGSWSVMSAYNKVNGLWCSENPHLLTDVLKREWGFQGFVVSDWGAVHSTVPTANAGLDVEMPKGDYLNESTLIPAVKRGDVTEATINDKVTRLLRTMFWTGLFDDAAKDDQGALNTPEHRAIALNVARESIVLLKNTGHILPFDRAKIKSLAVIGPNAAVARTGGGGSSMVTPAYAIAPLEGIRRLVGKDVDVRYAMGAKLPGDVFPVPSSALRPPSGASESEGLRGEYFANVDLSGTPAFTRIDKQINFEWGDGSPDKRLPVDGYSVRWTGRIIPPETSEYELSVMSDDGVRLYIDGKLIIDDWHDRAPEASTASIKLEAGRPYDIRLEYFESHGGAMVRLGWDTGNTARAAEALDLAGKADAVVIFAGLSSNFESEGFDRKTLALPESQEKLIADIAKANKNVVVVLNSGAPVLMDSWLSSVPGLLEAWYPGEEGGNAIAEVLFGDVNPSGKLPVTFLRRWEDSQAYGNYPGQDSTVSYAEGIFVGYRHFDRASIEPRFAFGFGLSYTSFTYESPIVAPRQGKDRIVDVSFDVKNTGDREGSEVAQVYVREVHPKVERPVRELKGFSRITLEPGESRRVTIALDSRAFAYYDVAAKEWAINPGTFEVLVGSSSRLIRFTKTVEIH